MSYLKNFRNALTGKEFLILDTKTTGLKRGEIVQIAIINSAGEVLLDTLIQPKFNIPAEATAIQGVSNDMVEEAPTWVDMASKIKSILEGKLLVVYNATYNRGMMHQTAERWDLPKVEWKEISAWHCAMDAYSEFYGEWNDYFQSYRWQKLVVAARNCNLPTDDAHDALADCLMTLGVVKHMLKDEANNG